MVGNDLKKKISLVVVLFVIILMATSSMANPLQAIKVSATLPFKSGAFAYDSGNDELLVTTGKAYVNEFGMQGYNLTNIISIISYRTKTVVANVTVGDSPISLVYDSGKGETFVANYGSGTVSVILDSNNSVIKTIDLKCDISYHGPYALVYDFGNGEIFASDPHNGIISVISDSTNEVVSTVLLGNNSGPEGLIYYSVKN